MRESYIIFNFPLQAWRGIKGEVALHLRKQNNLVSLSKVLRKTQTPWEARLWRCLRAKRFNHIKFKRQVPIGKYIVDFCCDARKLVIELDGSQHSEYRISQLDQAKQAYFTKEGYTLLRFWNNEIDNNLEGVLEKIYQVTTSLLTSPHAWGEG